jgi:hypothetical protein
LRTSKLPLRDPAGNIFGVLGSYEDISQSKQIEHQLRLEGLRLNYLLKMSAMMAEPESALFDFTLNAVIELTESDLGFIYFYDEETRILKSTPGRKSNGAVRRPRGPTVSIGQDRTLGGGNHPSAQAIVINDYEASNPYKRGVPRAYFAQTLPFAPAFDGDKIVAIAGVANKIAPYTEHDEGQLCLLMQGMSQIVQRKRAEEERERLIGDLQNALAEVKALSGLLPICSSCKKVRDDQGYWTQIERYIEARSDASFSHSICPDCLKKLYPEVAERLQRKE